MKLCKCCLVLLLCATPGYAIDLAEMQSIALQNRPLVEKYMTNLEKSEQDVVLARGGYYPSVDVSYTGTKLDEDSFTENEENSVAVGQLSMNLFAGWRDKYNLNAALKQKNVQELYLEGVRQDIQLNVALAYLDVYERRANRDVAETTFQTLDKAFKDSESRYQVGLIGKNELLKFRVDFDNADIQLKAADAGLKKSVNSLSREIGRVLRYEELDFKDFQSLPPMTDKEVYRQTMLTNRSEIKAVEKAIEASQDASEAQKGDYYPRVDAVGSWGRYDDDLINGNGTIKEDEWRAQVVLSMNLFSGFTTEASVAKAKIDTRGLQYDLAELKDTLNTDLDNLYIDFKVSLDNVEVALRSIEQAEENLRITKLKYEEGLQRETDLLDAISNLSRAKYNYVTVVRTVFLNDFRLTRMIDGF